MSTPLMPIICSTRESASRGGIGVDSGHRAVVAGVHRLKHVEGLAGADLAEDDPVGPHAKRVLDEVALGISPLPSIFGGRVSSRTTCCC